ncbi:MAG: SDR family oxidoreductase [Hyphomonadaceae bacterium]
MAKPHRVLITGCSTGIGRALAETLTARGHKVVATARSVETLKDLKAAAALSLDVTSEDSVARVVKEAGDIDVLVNNAGIGLWGPVEAASGAQVEKLFETNVFGPLRMQRAFLPQMRARRSGQIIQVSSAAGRVSGPLVGLYAASKHALEAMSEALRVEAAAFGVKVSIVEIGAVASAFPQNRESAALAGYEEVVDKFTKRLMSQRTAPTSSEDVAESIADIIEDGARDLRYEATADAVRIIAARRAQPDAEWESGLLASLAAQ